MVWLPAGEKNKICLFVSIEYTNVTNRQTDSASGSKNAS